MITDVNKAWTVTDTVLPWLFQNKVILKRGKIVGKLTFNFPIK